MNDIDYWQECILIAADENDINLTQSEVDALASATSAGHEHYSMAFYDPGWGGRMDEIENEYKKKLKDLQAEFDKYRSNAETAVKQALRQHRDDHVSIGEYGEVFRHGGRTTQIQ